MKVICISGKARHGKDTAAQIIKDDLEENGYSVLVTHYADLVKYVCKTFFGWDGEKNDYGRTLLQKVGTDTVRAQNPDYWVNFIRDILKMFDGEWDYILIPDTRFPNEIDVMKNSFDTIHLRIVRTNFKSNLTEEQQNHSSETSLDDIKPDSLIENNGSFIEFESSIKTWIKENIK